MTDHDKTVIDLNLLHRLLGVDDDETPDVLVRAARGEGWTLPELVLSVVEKNGRALDAAAADELRRARARHRRYVELLEEITAAISARVIKGPSLAARYPEGLVRPVGDLDLVVADEEAVWRAVRVVMDRHPIHDVHVSFFGHPQRHLNVVVAWPGEDSLLDKKHVVDICTAAYPGERGGPVQARAELPEDSFASDLLALCEERFQRPFGVKDFIDVAVLGLSETDRDQVVDAAAAWQLAPELRELLDLAAAHVDLGCLGPVRDALQAPAARELARRERFRRPEPAPGTEWMTSAFVDGRLVGGLLLRSVRRREEVTTAIHRYPDGALLRTPVGDYLLVDQPQVSEDQYERALAELALLDGEPS